MRSADLYKMRSANLYWMRSADLCRMMSADLCRMRSSDQGFKFRFGSHLGLDIETEYFVFRIVSVYHFGVHRIYIYIYINFLI